MKVKTSITLEEDTVRSLDRLSRRMRKSRSRLLQQAADQFLARRLREERDRRDLEILNRNADAMNREMEEILAVQANL